MPTVEERVRQVATALEEQSQDYYKLTLSQEDTSLMDSKIGGLPFMPEGSSLPMASDGKTPLKFLAQINVGHLIGNLFPMAMGILQFWIQDDDQYGMDMDDMSSQKQSRVIFYQSVRSCLSIPEIKEQFPSLLEEVKAAFPIQPGNCFKITAKKERSPLSASDFNQEGLFVAKYNELFPETPITSTMDFTDQLEVGLLDDLLDSEAGHKLLGIPNFAQSDPREEKHRDHILLFQLDSETMEDNSEILWGDCGVGNWFILPEDLKKGDFSKVLYHWDCC